jgi:hypothetical protein
MKWLPTILVAACLWAAALCSAQSRPKEVAGPLPTFPYQQGWFGADDAYSIPLTSTRSVWLLGDTLVADATATDRADYKSMPRNSLAITDCRPGQECSINYYWKSGPAEKPRSFFDTGREDLWYWPLDGYFDGKKLYLGQMIVRNKKGAGPEDPMGFEIAGTQWMVVENPLDPPEKWRIDSKELTNEKLWAGSSIFEWDGKVYFYSQAPAGEGKGYMTVLRVKKEKLADPASSWEYLDSSRKWRRGTAQADAARVIDQPISEMSVRYHPSIKKWVAVSIGPEFPSNRVVVRTAESPVGPWSEPVTVFHFPEMDPKNPIYDKDTFCYAAKEHVEFGDTKLVLTYACNSMKISKVIANMKLYRPQVVVLDLPPSER